MKKILAHSLKGSQEHPFHGRVYLIENGERRWIPCKEWIELQGFLWPDDVEWVTARQLNKYSEGSPIDYRKSKFLCTINVSGMTGLEIGALSNPVVSKEEGDIYYVDHASTEEIIIKYKHAKNSPSVDVSKICPVDFVWGKKPLRQIIPAHIVFDYIIASHVIEHVPDIIGWLQEMAEVLKPGGALILAVPDKRYTLDYFRQPTVIADLVDAYLNHYRRPTPRQIFDFCCNAIKVSASEAWDPLFCFADCERLYSDEAAMQLAAKGLTNEGYIDVHCSVFTAASFLDLLKRVFLFNVVNFKVVRFFAPEIGSNEFIVILEKLAAFEGAGEKIRIQMSSLSDACGSQKR